MLLGKLEEMVNKLLYFCMWGGGQRDLGGQCRVTGTMA